MTGPDPIPPPPDVPCAGCGLPTPYDAGKGPEHASWGESLRGAMGVFYIRTHRVRACVEQARQHGGFLGEGGKPYTWPTPRTPANQPPAAGPKNADRAAPGARPGA